MSRHSRVHALSAAVACMLLASRPSLAAGEQRGIAGTPWVVDGSVGVPRARGSEDFRVTAALGIGYAAPEVGAVADGELFSYAAAGDRGSADTTRASGSARGWWRFGSRTLSGEVGARGGAFLITSTFAPSSPGPQEGYFRDEDSVMFRGALDLGIQWEPANQLAVGARGGGGMQYESYGYVSTDPADDTLLDSDQIGAAGNAELRVRWAFLPDLAGARAFAGVSVYQLTRTRFVVGPATAQSVSESVITFTQVDVRTRLTVDLLLLEYEAITPFAYGGADWFVTRASAGSRTEALPSAGVGIATPWE